MVRGIKKYRGAITASAAKALTVAMLGGLGITVAGTTIPSAASAAVTTHCNAYIFAGTFCPPRPTGTRHTYKSGLGASAAAAGSTIGQYWYVAYTSSNASSPKYQGFGPVGSVLSLSFPNNTELLRGYTAHSSAGNLYGEGTW